jgi:hypothetical protein
MDAEVKAALDHMDEIVTLRVTRRDYHNAVIATARQTTSKKGDAECFSATLSALYKGEVSE